MLIETRTLGRTTRPLGNWSIPDPPAGRDGGGLTLRELIARVVRAEIEVFERRERARRLVRVTADAEIAEGAARWRIDPGGRPSAGPVDLEHAVDAALSGFDDGLYLVFFDGTEQRELDCEVFIRPDSKLLFFRLTSPAGAGRVYQGKVAAALAGSRDGGESVLRRLGGLKQMASMLTGRGHLPSIRALVTDAFAAPAYTWATAVVDSRGAIDQAVTGLR